MADIDRGEQIRTQLGSLAPELINLAGIPMGGPIALLASNLLSLGIGAGNKRREKEKSYNAGLEKGKQIAPPPPAPAPQVVM